MPQALPMVAAWAATAWTSAVAATATAVTAVTAGAISGTAATAVATAGLKFAATTAISAAAAVMMRPNTPSSGTTLDFKPDPKAPVRGAMGYTAVGGNKVFQATWGYKRVAMSLGVALSLGPIQGVAAFEADGSTVAFNPANQYEALGFYDGDMWQRTTRGLPGDAALLPPTGLKYGNPGLTGWGSANAAPQTAFAFWTMVLAKNPEDRDIFTNGVPDPRWVLNGMLVYQPRYDSTYPGGSGPQRRDDWRTWGWSQNPYDHALAWVRGHYKLNTDGSIDKTKRIAGVGAPDSAIDFAAFVEGANIADANGWTISGEWSTSDGKWQTLIAMLQAGGGQPINRGAQISVLVNAPRVSTYTYTKADLVGQAQVKPLTPRRDRKNTIIPRYRSQANGWEYVAAGEVTSSTYKTEDRGEQRSTEVEYVHVRDGRQAGQLAAYDLVNLREGLTATLPSKVHLMSVHAGDCITVNEPELAMVNQKFVVMRTTTDYKSAVVTLELRSETDAKHAFALGQTEQAPPSPKMSAVDPRYIDPPAPGDWSAVPQPPSGGTTQPIIIVIGRTEVGDAASIIIEAGLSEAGPWSTVYAGTPLLDGRYPSTGLLPGQSYWISIRYVAKNGAISDRLIKGPIVAGDLIAGDLSPESPVVKRITAMQDAIELAEGGIGSLNTAVASLNATVYTAGTGLKARSDAMFADINTASTGLKAQTASLLASLNTPTTGVLARLTATEGQVATNNTAAVNRLNALEATVNTAGTGLTARLATAESAIVTNRDAAAQRLSALEATVDGAGTGLSAKVSGLQSAVSDLVSGKADATDLVNLTARVFGAESVNIAQDQRLTTVEVDVAGKASAVRVAALETSIDTPSTGLKARLAVQEAATSDLVANKADATRVAALEATVNTAGTGLSARVAGLQSAVSNLAQGKADAVDLVNLTARVFDAESVNTAQNTRLNTVEVDVAGKASATRVEALEAAVNTPGTGLAARITTAEQAIATEATARAEAVSQLLARQNINRNLLPGGSGERGVVGWDAPAGLTVVDSPANGGSVFYKDYTGAGAVNHLHISPKVAIGEATHVTLSFKGGSQGFSGGVRLGYIGFYNDAGGYVGESATRPLTGGEVTAAKPSGATKAAFVAKVSGTASSSYAEVFFRQIKIEPGQVATIYSNDALDQYLSSSVGELRQATIDLAAGKADASRVTTLEASVNTPGTGISARLTNVESVAASADGRAKAIKGVVTDVNGYIAGYSSSNDGTTAAFEILADVLAIRSPGGGERTEYRNGRWYIYSPAETTRTVYGKALGGSQKITWWTGPDSVAEGAETKANAYVYISQNTVGGARFGGTDIPTGASKANGARAFQSLAGAATASSVVSAVQSGSLIEMTAALTGGSLSADAPLYGKLSLYEASAGSQALVHAENVVIASDGLVNPNGSYGAEGVSVAASRTLATKNGDVTYSVTFARTSGSSFVAGAILSGSVIITPPA